MSTVGHRYKDVLFALAVASSFNQSLGKLQLQKFIYLADVLSPIWDLVSSGGYHTYFHGPYNQAVQNAVDVLAFRGAVEIVESKFDDKENVRVRYQISEIGMKIVENIKVEAVLNRRYELFQLVGYYVDKRGWVELRRMVYSEATYITAKVDGLGKVIQPDSLLTNDSVQILLGFQEMVRGGEISRNNLTSIFFNLLDNYHLLVGE